MFHDDVWNSFTLDYNEMKNAVRFNPDADSLTLQIAGK